MPTLKVNHIQISTGSLILCYKDDSIVCEIYDTIYTEQPISIPAEFDNYQDWHYEAWGAEFENCTYTKEV